MKRIIGAALDRFVAEHETDHGCWLWRGAPTAEGYGRFKLNGRTMPAHRAVYERMRGAIPRCMYLCHRCDVRLCCNPAHLFIGTQAENVADCKSKGRLPRGEKVGTSKITADIVRAIRRDPATQQNIAARFGVSQSLVSAIRRGERWSHVTD